MLERVLSDEAHVHARRALRKFDLPADDASDIIHDTWLDINATFARRDAPYPHLDSERAVAKYANTVITNNVVDRVRKASHRRERPLPQQRQDDDVVVAQEVSDSPDVEELHDVDTKHLAIQLRTAVAQRTATNVERCHGCGQNIVFAVALYVCNAAGAINETVEDHLDDLIYRGLKVNDPATFDSNSEKATDAQRQKKSRCGRCIKTLLRDAADDIGLAVST